MYSDQSLLLTDGMALLKLKRILSVRITSFYPASYIAMQEVGRLDLQQVSGFMAKRDKLANTYNNGIGVGLKIN